MSYVLWWIPWVNSPLSVSKRASMDLISAQWPVFRLSRFLWEIKQRAVTLNNFHKVFKKRAGFSRFKTSSWDVVSVIGKSPVNQCLWSLHVSMQITAIMDTAWNKIGFICPCFSLKLWNAFQIQHLSGLLWSRVWGVQSGAWPSSPSGWNMESAWLIIQHDLSSHGGSSSVSTLTPMSTSAFPTLTVAMWWALGQKTRCLGLWGPIYLIFLPFLFFRNRQPSWKRTPYADIRQRLPRRQS